MPAKVNTNISQGSVDYVPQKSTVSDFNVKKQNNEEGTYLKDPESLKRYADSLASKAGDNVSSDDVKYYVAVKEAENRLSDAQDLDKNRFKEEIDDIFQNELGAEKTGREIRGENAFTDVVGGLKDFTDNMNKTIGQGMKGVWDFAAGGFGDIFGVGDTVRNAMSADDLAFIPDILEDILVAGIMPPGVGLALVAGKNAIQQSDNLASALSDRDIITQQGLEGTQRAGKFLESLGTVGLSSLAGVGKLTNLGKLNKEMTTVGNKAVEDALKSGNKISLDDARRLSSDVINDAYKNNKKALSKGVKKRLKAGESIGISTNPLTRQLEQFKAGKDYAGSLMKKETPENIAKLQDNVASIEKSIEETNRAIKNAEKAGKSKKVTSLQNEAAELEKSLEEANAAVDFASKRHPLLAMQNLTHAAFYDPANSAKTIQGRADAEKFIKMMQESKNASKPKGVANRALNYLKPFGQRGLQFARTGGMLAPMAIVSDMAENGGDLTTSIANVGSYLTSGMGDVDQYGFGTPEGSLSKLIAAFPLGTMKAGKSVLSPTGKRNAKWSAPTRTAAYANYLAPDYSDISVGSNEDDVFTALKLADERMNNASR